MKKLFISADLEGCCDVAHWHETEPSQSPALFEKMQGQMTKEVAAACKGAISAGFSDILVKDAHETGRNISHGALPRGVRLNRDWSGSMFSMIGGAELEHFDALAFLGYHDSAFSPGNPLSHTQSLEIDKMQLNGALASEFMIWAYAAAYLKIPIVFLSGDSEICRKAQELIPNITTFATKQGVGGSVTSYHPDDVIDGMERAMEAALSGDLSRCALAMPPKFNLEIRFKTHQMATFGSAYTGAKLLDAKTLSFESEDYLEIMRFIHFVVGPVA